MPQLGGEEKNLLQLDIRFSGIFVPFIFKCKKKKSYF